MNPIAETSTARRAFALAALLALVHAAPALAGVTISEVTGTVQIRKAGTMAWGTITKNHVMESGDEIKTGRSSRCIIIFDDGSKVEIGPSGSFTLEEAQPASSSIRFNLGFMKAWVAKTVARRFQVRTPTAVCSVRGTGFDVAVQDDGRTSVGVFEGLVGVADMKGNETLVKEGERVDVGREGLGQKAESGPAQGGPDKAKQALKREVGLDMTKEEIQAAAALEQKAAIYQEGKALIDVNGNRVRLEQYIIRPAANQFKLVVLNERTDRFDFFYYLGTFNRPMPEDMSIALRQIQGQAFTAPAFFLTNFETGRSNTQDSVLETASGGHLVDVNNNAIAADNVTLVVDPAVDGLLALAPGQPFFKTVFDTYSLKFNGVNHHAWTSANGNYVATLDAQGFPVFNPLNLTGAQNLKGTAEVAGGHLSLVYTTNLIEPPNCENIERCTIFPEAGKIHQSIYLQNAAGTVWERFDNYVISDEGKVANTSDFAGATGGASFKNILLNWNFQQIITASEFNGRKIDLVVAPRILIQSGLIP